MSTHNIGCYGELTKIVLLISPNLHLVQLDIPVVQKVKRLHLIRIGKRNYENMHGELTKLLEFMLLPSNRRRLSI